MKAPKLSFFTDAAEDDVLARMAHLNEQRIKQHSTNLLERLDKESNPRTINRRTNVIRFGHELGPMAFAPSFPNADAITRLFGALVLEQSDAWVVTRRYMSMERVADPCQPADIESLPLAKEQSGDANRRRQASDRLRHHVQAYYYRADAP